MSMNERDRIDIIATLHDRFNRPAEEIISKMEKMEDQADETGDKMDDLGDSIDRDTKSTRRNTKEVEQNTKVRRRHNVALDEQADVLQRGTRNLRDNNRALRDGLRPSREYATAQHQGARAASQMADSVKAGIEAYDESDKAVQRASRSIQDHTRKTARARDELGRFTKTTEKTTETTKENTKATEDNTKATEDNTRQRKRDRDEWTKWDNKIGKITRGFGKRFRPIGAFYQNYFKIIGAFRALLFSDIGAAIPQLITALVALGAAFNASLAPAGRLLATTAQLVPAMAAFIQTQSVVKMAIGGVTKALEVLNDENATWEEISKAQEEAGENTWAMAEYVQQLTDKFDPLKRQVRETFLEGMVPAVKDLVDTYFPLLRDELTKTASIMNGELKEGIKNLQTPEKQQTIADVMERSSVASGLFVDIMWSLLDVFIELADAAGPAFLETLEAIDGLLDRFSDWIRDNKDDLTNFFLEANDTAGNFFKGIGFILTGLSGIAEAAKPLEDFLYGGLLDRLEGWSEKMNDPKQQEVMRENYEKMIPNLEAIGNLIGAIIDGAKEIATSEYFAPLINDLADNGIPLLFEYLKKLDETVGPPLLRITEALEGMDPGVLTSILKPLGDALGALATALELVVPLFSALPRPMQEVVMYGMGLAAMGLPGIFMLLLGPLSLLDNVLRTFTDKGLLARVKDGFDKLKDTFEKLKDTKLGKWLDDVARKLGLFFKPVGEFLEKHLGKGAAGGLIARIFGKGAGKAALAVLGPVGAVIGILWLLWDVLKWLWDNVKPFRDFMTGIWDWIVEAWNVSIDWIVNTAVPWIVDAFQRILDKIVEVGQGVADFYNKWIKPVVDFFVWMGKIIFVTMATIAIVIGSVIGWIWNTLLAPFLAWLWNGFAGGIWDVMKWIGDSFVWLWESGKIVWGYVVDSAQWAWDQIVAGAQLLWTGLQLIWGAITASAQWLWDSLKLVWSGIVAGFEWVRDRIAAAWDWVKNVIIAPLIQWFLTWVVPIFQWVADAIARAFEWLRDRVTAVWNWIKDVAVRPAVNWFMEWVWPVLKNILDWIGDKFTWLKDRVTSVWNGIKDIISSVYENQIKPIFDKFGETLVALQESFRVARDAIGLIWDGLKDKVRGPAQYVVDVVYNNGIRKIWNELADAVDLGSSLPVVAFGGVASGGSTAQSGGRSSTRRVAAFDTGGYTGPGSKYDPAGIVHADEFVIKKDSQRSLRREAPGFLDALNKYGAKALQSTGHMGGYARGGRVLGGWRDITSLPHPGLRVTSTFRAGARTAGTGSVSLHARGLAADFAGPAADMRNFFNYVRDNYRANELIYTPMGGRQLSRGGIPRANFKPATARGHTNHVHVGGYGAGDRAGKYIGDAVSSAAGIWNPFEGMIDRFTQGIKNKFSNAGKFVDIGVGVTKKLVTGATDFVMDKLTTLGGYTDASTDTAATSGGSGGAERWRSVATNALKHTGDFSDANLSALLRRMNQESGGNPNAINNWDSNARRGTPSKGLMQVIDPTFRSYRDPSLSSNIYDPMANIVASIRYAKSRYGNLASAYNRRGGYFNGGLVDHMRFMGGPVETWGNTLVGEFGPELFMPADGGPGSILGLHGPELMSFDREGAIAPHRAVAALGAYNEHIGQGTHSEHNETSHYDVKVTVGGGSTEADIEGAVRRAIAQAERKKRERR